MMKKLLPIVVAAACIHGTAKAETEPYIGEITNYASGFCPPGWLPADGRLLPTKDYGALYSLFGTAYGGDGVTSFGLPKLVPYKARKSATNIVCVAVFGVYPSKS